MTVRTIYGVPGVWSVVDDAKNFASNLLCDVNYRGKFYPSSSFCLGDVDHLVECEACGHLNAAHEITHEADVSFTLSGPTWVHCDRPSVVRMFNLFELRQNRRLSWAIHWGSYCADETACVRRSIDNAERNSYHP